MDTSDVKYKIKVDVGQPRQDTKYYDWDTIYEQLVDKIDLEAVIRAVNNMPAKEDAA